MERHILLIDDSLARRQHYARALLTSSTDPQVRLRLTLAGSIAAGQLQATRSGFDLVVAPLRQDQQSLAFLQNLREIRPHLPTLLLQEAEVSPFYLALVERLGGQVAPQPHDDAALRALLLATLGLIDQNGAGARSAAVAPPLPERPAPAAPPARASLTSAQLAGLRGCLARLARTGGARYIALIDISGQEIAGWAAGHPVAGAELAALSAAGMLATLELGWLIGRQRTCHVLIQEHEGQTVIVARIDDSLLLLLALAATAAVGVARVAIRRAAHEILQIYGSPAAAPAPQIDRDFEQEFANHIQRWTP